MTDIKSLSEKSQKSHYQDVGVVYSAAYGDPKYGKILEYFESFGGSLTRPAEEGVYLVLGSGARKPSFLSGVANQIICIDIDWGMLNQLRGRDRTVQVVLASGFFLPFMSGTIHHVYARGCLHHMLDQRTVFKEIATVMNKDGYLVFQEPFDDFWLWRAIRFVVYRVSNLLAKESELPLRFHQTENILKSVELEVDNVKPVGLASFLLLGNPDISWVTQFIIKSGSGAVALRMCKQLDNIIAMRLRPGSWIFPELAVRAVRRISAVAGG